MIGQPQVTTTRSEDGWIVEYDHEDVSGSVFIRHDQPNGVIVTTMNGLVLSLDGWNEDGDPVILATIAHRKH